MNPEIEIEERLKKISERLKKEYHAEKLFGLVLMQGVRKRKIAI